jgi:hypothetical protein
MLKFQNVELTNYQIVALSILYLHISLPNNLTRVTSHAYEPNVCGGLFGKGQYYIRTVLIGTNFPLSTARLSGWGPTSNLSSTNCTLSDYYIVLCKKEQPNVSSTLYNIDNLICRSTICLFKSLKVRQYGISTLHTSFDSMSFDILKFGNLEFNI